MPINNENVLVSVCMTAYNQAKYIVEAIEGVIKQKTTYSIELLIGEDFGNRDNTLEICYEYEQKYPNIIRVIHDGKNHGMVDNEQRLINEAKGKYIAFCEADDYWIDPFKIQKQVNILQNNPQYSACVCRSKVIFEDNSQSSKILMSNLTNNTVFTFNDLVKEGTGFQTASFIFRTANIRNYQNLPSGINGWDRAVFWLNALYGDIYCFNDVMCVYRKNMDGVSSLVTVKMMLKDLDIVNWLKKSGVKIPINALLSDIYLAIISCPVKISTIDLLKNYLFLVFYAKKSEIDNRLILLNASNTLEYRLPIILRKILRRLGLFNTKKNA